MQHCGLFSIVRGCFVQYIRNIKIFITFFREVLRFLELQHLKLPCVLPLSEAYSESTQTSDMEFFAAKR